MTLRATMAEGLGSLGLLAAIRRLRLRIAISRNHEVRQRERLERECFSRFRRQYGAVLGAGVSAGARASKTALIISNRWPTIEVELCVIKALQLAGFRPVVLLEDDQRVMRRYYALAGVRDLYHASHFLTSRYYGRAAAAVVERCESLDDLLVYAPDSVRVGRIAASTAIRQLRTGSLQMRAPEVRRLLVTRVAASMTAAAESQRMLDTVRPDLVLFGTTEYTPKGELFDTCLKNGLDVVAYDSAHTRNTLMFKRYSHANRDDHLATLSAATWARVRDMAWTGEQRDRLARELKTDYADGNWCGACPKTVNTRFLGAADARRLLGLDPEKKTAFIFAHILWDAPLMWARTLFPTYEDWLIETVRAACRNDEVNWVVKIHPANVWRCRNGGHHSEPAETRALREHLGTLPRHVVVVPPEAEVSTLSLFEVMDYCLTVRGTVGIEAARLGIPVLTSAAGARFDRHGFTIDSDTRAEYLDRLAHIQHTPALSPQQRELAERFAYGMFVLRPLEGTTWDADEARGWSARDGGRPQARIHVHATDGWGRAPDLAALKNWFLSRDEDFLTPCQSVSPTGLISR